MSLRNQMVYLQFSPCLSASAVYSLPISPDLNIHSNIILFPSISLKSSIGISLCLEKLIKRKRGHELER